MRGFFQEDANNTKLKPDDKSDYKKIYIVCATVWPEPI
jgi:hypothetical protein